MWVFLLQTSKGLATGIESLLACSSPTLELLSGVMAGVWSADDCSLAAITFVSTGKQITIIRKRNYSIYFIVVYVRQQK
jgi:hypothetical protein